MMCRHCMARMDVTDEPVVIRVGTRSIGVSGVERWVCPRCGATSLASPFELIRELRAQERPQREITAILNGLETSR